MPLNDIIAKSAEINSLKSLVRTGYILVFGGADLHSYIRWRAIKKLINLNAKTILDAGCGSGMMTFEVAKKVESDVKIIAIDYAKESVKVAQSLSKLAMQGIYFLTSDIMHIGFKNEQFDEILCINVLEHVLDDSKAVAELSRILKNNGTLVISVPTPNYPRYFGKDFADRIGHLRNGYWHWDLEGLMEKHNLKMVSYNYYTQLPSALACSIVYRRHINKYILFLIKPILNMISHLDIFFSGHRNACSLALKIKKV